MVFKLKRRSIAIKKQLFIFLAQEHVFSILGPVKIPRPAVEQWSRKIPPSTSKISNPTTQQCYYSTRFL